MKLFFIISLVVLIPLGNLFCQDKVYLDTTGKEISFTEFQVKWRDRDTLRTRWDYIGKDGKRYCQLKNNVYVAGKIQINEIKKQIENLTSRVIDSSKNIFISYYYKDDLCSTSIDNKWARTEIKEMKRYYKPQIKKIKHTGTIFICLFEQGIFLKNKPKSKYEYFYTDTNNFFRNNIFKSPTLCGSYALFKPNGEVLIFNGESRQDFMIKNLKSKKWNTFFKYYYKQNPTP